MRVLLCGYYGFGNLGDEALLSGLAGSLSERGHTPVVLSGAPAATRALHGLEAHHRTRSLLTGLLGVEAVVSGGGGLLQDGTSSRSLSYYLGVIRLARVLRRPVVVYGQSLGPLSSAGRARVKRALRAVPLLLRDAPSRALAASLGLDSDLVADPALLLPAPDRPDGERRDHDRGSAGSVVLVPRGGQPQLNASLVRLAGRLVRAGRAVTVASLHPAEDDASVRALVAAVPEATYAPTPTPAAAVALFTSATFVVSVRLHGCILAATAGTGYAGLSYDTKVAGFLELAGAPSFEAPVDEEALAALALTGSRGDKDATRRLIQLANEGIDRLVDELERGLHNAGRR